MSSIQTSLLSPDDCGIFYGVHAADLFAKLGIDSSPIGGMVGILAAGSDAVEHSHHELELFIILSGSGKFISDDQTVALEAGTVVASRAFSAHQLKAFPDSELRFVSIWWDSQTERDQAAVAKEESSDESSFTLVSATPPTPNGDLHLGHLSGPFLAADVLARAVRTTGADAASITGIDINQSYVPLKASQGSLQPREVSASFGERIEKVLQFASMRYDAIIHPDRGSYESFIQAFFSRLFERGALVERERDALFCKSTGRYLFEAHVSGACPHCHAGSDGNACEACGMFNQCTDLGAPRSKYGSGEVEVRRIRQLVLPLERHRAELERFWQRTPMKARLRQLCRRAASQPLPDVAITHPTDWGIPCTTPGFTDQVLYVWAEMAPAFTYAIERMLGRTDRTAARWIQCFGFDNAAFYLMLFPALWRADDAEAVLPDGFITNEFLLLDQAKFSTSRNHAIWGLDFLEEHDADDLRFSLAKMSPEEFQSNFTLGKFEEYSTGLWVDELGPWLKHLARLPSLSAGAVADPGAWTPRHRHFYEELVSFEKSVRAHYRPSSFSMVRAAWTVERLVMSARRFGLAEASGEEGKTLTNEGRTAVQLQIAALAYLAVGVAPLCPTLAGQLWKALFLEGEPTWRAAEALMLHVRTVNIELLAGAAARCEVH